MTALQLIGLWIKRDNQYRERKVKGLTLTDHEADMVMWWRRAEAKELVAPEQAKAIAYLNEWAVPMAMTS